MRIIAAFLAFVIAGCGGGAGSSAVPSTTSAVALPRPTPTPTAKSSTNDTPYTCPNAQTSSGTLDCTKLPLGDQKFSISTAKVGYIYSCQSLNGTPVASSGPWISAASNTWSLPAKIAVSGAVSWSGTFAQTQSGATNTLASNEVPVSPNTTGVFPIAASDPAYQYDRNPNSIQRHATSVALNANPAVATNPTCVGMGPIGMTVTGVAIYNAFDAAGYDAVAHEEQDACHGHPDPSNTYHYHGILQACVHDAGSAGQNSSLLGYALDGFGIYGPWYGGKILTSTDLDACHGTTSAVMWNGRLTNIYHYVSTYEFPYTLGCYRGSPVKGL